MQVLPIFMDDYMVIANLVAQQCIFPCENKIDLAKGGTRYMKTIVTTVSNMFEEIFKDYATVKTV